MAPLGLLAMLLAGCPADELPGVGEPDSGRPQIPDLGIDAGENSRRDAMISSRRDAVVMGMDVPPIGMDRVRPPHDAGSYDGGVNPNDLANTRRDTDCDGLSDAYEFATVYPDGSRTDPANPDTDGDGITDGVEAGITGPVANMTGPACPMLAVDADPSTRTSPTVADSDGDGLADGIEDRNRDGRLDPDESSPRLRDSDGDGLADNVEDANGDGIRDMNETHPQRRDTDGDLISDGVEDTNRNGMVDAGETNPRVADSDGDGLDDGAEDTNRNGRREMFETDPRSADTDCDGLTDSAELMLGTSPIVPDTDGDGIPDGVEAGITMAVAGTNCPMLAVDQDPTTTTDPLSRDSDGDGLADGVEDGNRNGRVDAGETNPGAADTDMDGIPDGDEVAAGFDPTDPTDPPPGVGTGITAVCSTANLKVVDFNEGTTGNWTLATEQSVAYARIAVQTTSVSVGAIDDQTNGISGFVLQTPPLGGQTGNLSAQLMYIQSQLVSTQPGGYMGVARASARNIRSHDGFDTAVSGAVDITVSGVGRNAASVRAQVLSIVSGLPVTSFPGLPTATGPTSQNWVAGYQVLYRPAVDRIIVVVAILQRNQFEDAGNPRSIMVNDLTNGTALALKGARRDKGCDPFQASGRSVADFIWMADISGSTDDDRGRIYSAAQQVFNALASNGVDFRMGVVPHTSNDYNLGANNGGAMRGVGFTRDAITFVNNLSNTVGSDGCEFGLEAVSNSIRQATPRSAAGAPENPQRIRGDATLAVVYISDEHAQELTDDQSTGCFGYRPSNGACTTGYRDLFTSNNNNVCQATPSMAQQACIDQVLAPYLTQLQAEQAIAFAQVIDPNPPGACNAGQFRCPNSQQDSNEPGVGYIEMVNATQGTFYSPCTSQPGLALQRIVDAVSGAASQFQLRGAPISSTIKVGITRMGASMTTLAPRDKRDGFDYDPASNSIFFRGSNFRPAQGDRVTISYRVWQPPEIPCGGPCDPGFMCDPVLGQCLCDASACNANCGPGEACNLTSCQCECTPDCNGTCGPGTVCNQNTCACECPADCGGTCGPGTVCNPTTCACDCDTNCGGACAGTSLECDQGSCTCQCPTNCGNECTGNTLCNPSTCACTCDVNCTQGCPGMAVCDPASDCACVCPNNCGGGCPDGTVCDPASCECACSPGCDAGCPNNQVCDPTNDCNCVCPSDCGGCAPNERCNAAECRCVPIV